MSMRFDFPMYANWNSLEFVKTLTYFKYANWNSLRPLHISVGYNFGKENDILNFFLFQKCSSPKIM